MTGGQGYRRTCAEARCSEGNIVSPPLNMLLIILDDLREDALGAALEEPGRCVRTRTSVAAAPWTLPSCTSILRGTSAPGHGHFWREPPLGANPLLDALPSEYRKIGIINNGAIAAGSGVEAGFDRWLFTADQDEPFRRAGRAIRRAGRRRPSFIVLHSNIVHDYCLPVAERYVPAGTPPVLGDRVISWRDTTDADRIAAVDTYAACAAAQLAHVRTILDQVRERDDFVVAITSDHGEGFDFDLGRIHHGGRVHQDLLHVPLFFDLPSTVPEDRRRGLADAVDTHAVGGIDVLPTLFELAGHRDLPAVDGVPVHRIGTRTLVSEDRRYLYLADRFRLNYRGYHKHMSSDDLERNQTMLRPLARGPFVRSFLRHPHKVIATAVQLASGQPGTDGSGAERRRTLADLGDRLLGSPVRCFHHDGLFAFELFDLASDPREEHNLLDGVADWRQVLVGAGWDTTVTMPGPAGPAGSELGLAEMTDGSDYPP
jgi:hypothetical protein